MRYFCRNLLLATEKLSGAMEDGAFSVPVPTGSSQGLHPQLMEEARAMTKETVPGYDMEVTYL